MVSGLRSECSRYLAKRSNTEGIRFHLEYVIRRVFQGIIYQNQSVYTTSWDQSQRIIRFIRAASLFVPLLSLLEIEIPRLSINQLAYRRVKTCQRNFPTF